MKIIIEIWKILWPRELFSIFISRLATGPVSSTLPLRSSESYLFKCIQELDQLSPDEPDYQEKTSSSQELCLNFYLENGKAIDHVLWTTMFKKSVNGRIGHVQELLFFKVVYYNGVDQEIRHLVWPFLLNHYGFGMSNKEREQKELDSRQEYKRSMAAWKPFEEFVNLREKMSTGVLQKVSNNKNRKIIMILFFFVSLLSIFSVNS